MVQQKISGTRAYRFLEAGPVVLVTTAGDDGPNVMTAGFHMMMRHPGTIGLVLGPWDHSYTALRDTGECVLAIPGVDLAEVVVDIGNCSGREVDKFERFGLTPAVAATVAAPIIGECLVNVECKVIDTSLVDEYDLFILEATAIWRDLERPEQRTFHHRGDGTFTVDGEVVDLRDRMVLWKQFQD
jgi:flavin reductase (DIM6/NTAB) family NADH-FMN oxidoreductase RutF